jgi:hypothetical protein
MAKQGDQQDHHHRDPHAGEGNGAALLKPHHSIDLFQLRPRLPRVPTLLKLRLGLFQGRHPIRARHRTVDGHRPEPAQTVGSAPGLIDAADIPVTAVDGVVRAVLVDRGAEAGFRDAQGRGPQRRRFLSSYW